MATRQLCTFEVEGYLFGVDVAEVQEVIRYQRMTPVPLAAPEVSGLINLRGQIVTALDLRRRLGLHDRTDGELPLNVVVRTADGSVSLQVDEIGDVIDADDNDFELPPDTVSAAARALITGTYKLDDRLLLALDTDLVVQAHA